MKDADIVPFYHDVARGESGASERACEYTTVFELLAAVSCCRRRRPIAGVNKATREPCFARSPIPPATMRRARSREADRSTRSSRSASTATKAKNLLRDVSLADRNSHGGRVPRDARGTRSLAGRRPQDRQRGAEQRLRRSKRSQSIRMCSASRNRTGLAIGQDADREVELILLEAHAGRVPGPCAPLVDPARSLCVPGEADRFARSVRGRQLHATRRLSSCRATCPHGDGARPLPSADREPGMNDVTARPPVCEPCSRAMTRTLQFRHPPRLGPSTMSKIEEFAERVERLLLLRHDELQKTNQLLAAQLATRCGFRGA